MPYLDRVSTNGEHLLTLINNVLDLSRIESGKMPMLVEEIDCNAMVVETVRMFLGHSAISAVSVIAHRSPPQLNLSTDASKSSQGLINLIGNALKFTTNGSVTASVNAEPERHANRDGCDRRAALTTVRVRGRESVATAATFPSAYSDRARRPWRQCPPESIRLRERSNSLIRTHSAFLRLQSRRADMNQRAIRPCLHCETRGSQRCASSH